MTLSDTFLRHVASFALVVAPLVACGGAASQPAATGGEADKTVAPAVWKDDLAKPEKLAIMKQRVTPEIGKLFQAREPKEFASFDCKVCHGPNKQAPKDFLPKLAMKDGKLLAFAEKPEDAKFMAEKVVPAMAHALGVAPYDPATHQGFGCGGCHTIEMK